MAEHASLTDPHLHEPKGIASAPNASVYVANGSGSGSWTVQIPSQTGNNGKSLITDGASTSWSDKNTVFSTGVISNLTGTPVIKSGINCASVSKLATGHYEVNFSSNATNEYYRGPFIQVQSGVSVADIIVGQITKTVSGFTFRTYRASTSAAADINGFDFEVKTTLE